MAPGICTVVLLAVILVFRFSALELCLHRRHEQTRTLVFSHCLLRRPSLAAGLNDGNRIWCASNLDEQTVGGCVYLYTSRAIASLNVYAWSDIRQGFPLAWTLTFGFPLVNGRNSFW